MAEDSKIEWCDHTFNPWIGCTKISPACDHCYAERSTPARTLNVAWGTHTERHLTGPATWKLPLRWNENAEAFAAKHGRRQRVFCSSLADVFDNAVNPSWRADLFGLILKTPHLDWLLLTKRIGNVKPMLAEMAHGSDPDLSMLDMMPLPNVWIGATICNPEEADRDIPKLLTVRAAKHFLSMEPLLGAVHIRDHWLIHHHPGDAAIDWVIVGGESGPSARPMHPDWARSLRDQCTKAGVPFLFKQWGEWGPTWAEAHSHQGIPCPPDPAGQRSIAGTVHVVRRFKDGEELRALYPVIKVGKKAAGRLLDGETWDHFPIP